MVRCKAGEILRSEAYFMYAAATKGEAERLEMAVYRQPLIRDGRTKPVDAASGSD